MDPVGVAAVALIAGGMAALAASVSTARERRQSGARRDREVAAVRAQLDEALATRHHLEDEANRLHVLEQVDAQRSALLRSVSHDLRTPLATIRAVTSDLRSGGASYDDETRDDLLELVEDEAERLDRLVGNLLSLSRIEAGALQPDRQAVDLDELVRDRVRHLARLFRQVRIVVDIPEDLPLVDGDYTQLEQVVTNLLENAARHAPATSTVTVSAHADPHDAGFVALVVQDEGIGIPNHERQRVFEPFRRGEGSRSSGIGLAICKAVVDAHGGRIGVDRTPGGGATFTLTLPVRPPGRDE